ncbi:sialate O-acetylesterase, partial [Alphaproteobacteria bacterium]|nr:sialate O-acetylesterase [Alphaproteobacteria bacterium]
MKIRRKKTSQTKANKIFPDKERIGDIKNKKLFNASTSLDIIVLIGQSNSANSVLSKTYLQSKHLNFYNKKTYQLSNPVLGANGDKDCIAPAIANKIKSKKPVIFLTNGWGGTSIYDWSHPKSMLTKYVRNNLKHLLKRHSLKYVIWIQGESDNNSDVDYVKEFNLFRTNLFKGIEKKKYNNSKFIITQTSICGTDRDRALNTQQKKLA